MLVVWFFGPIIASHLFVVAATVDRFIAIRWSLRYSEIVSGKTVKGVAMLVWTYSFSVPLCGEMVRRFFRSSDAHNVVVFMTSSTCLMSAAIVIVLNAWMVVFAWKSLVKSELLLSNQPDVGMDLVINQIIVKANCLEQNQTTCIKVQR